MAEAAVTAATVVVAVVERAGAVVVAVLTAVVAVAAAIAGAVVAAAAMVVVMVAEAVAEAVAAIVTPGGAKIKWKKGGEDFALHFERKEIGIQILEIIRGWKIDRHTSGADIFCNGMSLSCCCGGAVSRVHDGEKVRNYKVKNVVKEKRWRSWGQCNTLL